MSTISSVNSASTPYVTQPTGQNGFAQLANNFLAIGSALQSGNVTGAQTALANFQQSVSTNLQNTADQLFSANPQASSAYQNLVKDLNSGNASGAQKDFSSLLASLQNSSSTTALHRGHHHHHHHGQTGSATASSSSTASTSSGSAGKSSSSSGTAGSSGLDSDGDHDGSKLNATA